MIKNVSPAGSAKLDEVHSEFYHNTLVFPEDSDETVTLTAKNVANTWSDWVELADNNAVTFSSKIATYAGHITYMIVENSSASSKVYMVEFSYGGSHTIFGRARFYGGAVPKQAQRMFAGETPAGETVYYRMKCETLSATAEVHLRYHLHD